MFNSHTCSSVVLSCRDRGFATDWFPVRGTLLNILQSCEKLEKLQEWWIVISFYEPVQDEFILVHQTGSLLSPFAFPCILKDVDAFDRLCDLGTKGGWLWLYIKGVPAYLKLEPGVCPCDFFQKPLYHVSVYLHLKIVWGSIRESCSFSDTWEEHLKKEILFWRAYVNFGPDEHFIEDDNFVF